MTRTRTRPTESAPHAPIGPLVAVGVGAVLLDEAGRVLLMRRGPCARNEQGMWACPGGALAVGETLQEAIVREVREECGLAIVVLCQPGAFDHVLPDGAQWVSVAYLAQVVDGEPVVQEPGKCSACAWFPFDLDALPEPLSPLASIQLEAARLLLPSAACPPDKGRASSSARSPPTGFA
jgi:8-oxo-dGTP diphosphatase